MCPYLDLFVHGLWHVFDYLSSLLSSKGDLCIYILYFLYMSLRNSYIQRIIARAHTNRLKNGAIQIMLIKNIRDNKQREISQVETMTKVSRKEAR